MSRSRRRRWGWIALTLLGPASRPAAAAAAPAETFNYDRFDAVTLHHGRGRPHEVVLLLSGADGWDAAAAALAQRLADHGSLVAGIDFGRYRAALGAAAETCVSPASDLENLSHYLQAKLKVRKYLEPILVGEGAGATLAYATLMDAPEGLFKGALSIGFSPDLEMTKALCDTASMTTQVRRDAGGAVQGVTLSAATQSPGKWIVLPGGKDQPSNATDDAAVAALRAFVAAVPGAELVNPGDAPWLPQFDAAVARLAGSGAREEARTAALPRALADLPLIVVPARLGSVASAASGSDDQWFGVFLTGDGGWVGLDKGVSNELAKHGIPIIGWDSLKYFWKRRTPEGASQDLDRVLRYYAHAWGRSHVLLIGYSQGADTLPFMLNRLPEATHRLVGYTTLLGISDNALWEFHLATWLGKPPKGIPTAPELERWSGAPYLCIYGESDADAACEQETGHDGTALKMGGGHHFGGGYDKIADEILSRLPPIITTSGSDAAPEPGSR